MKIILKDICKVKGITQKELAKKVGTTETNLTRVTKGNTSLQLLEKIALALEVPISALFEDASNASSFIALVVNNGNTHTFTDKKEFKEFAEKI